MSMTQGSPSSTAARAGIKAAGFDGRSDLVRSVQGVNRVVEDGMSGRNVQRHGHSSIANETVFEPRGLNGELQSLVHQKAGMTSSLVRGAGKFPGRSGASSWNRGSGSGRPWSR